MNLTESDLMKRIDDLLDDIDLEGYQHDIFSVPYKKFRKIEQNYEILCTSLGFHTAVAYLKDEVTGLRGKEEKMPPSFIDLLELLNQ